MNFCMALRADVRRNDRDMETDFGSCRGDFFGLGALSGFVSSAARSKAALFALYVVLIHREMGTVTAPVHRG